MPDPKRRSDAPRRVRTSGWTPYRSRHRQRNDHASHQEAQADLPPVLDHELVCNGDPVLVQDQASFLAVLDDLRACGTFGYDSEFIGEHSYHPSLCVIQLATAERICLIDPLADGIDIGPLWELIAAEDVEVVVHAGEQDLEPVVRHLGRPPKRIFDTQLVAGFAGLDYPLALGKLATQVLDANLGPGLKFSQWDRRPLTNLQIAYAANDVRYLPLLRQALLDRVEEMGNSSFATAACAELADADLYVPDPHSRKLKAKGLGALNRKQLAVLNELKVWREEVARHENIPPRSLLPDQVLMNLAAATVGSNDELAKVKGVPHPIRKAYGREIIERTTASLEGPLPKVPRPLRPRDEDEKQALATFWQAIKDRCDERRVAIGVVTNRADVTRYFLRSRQGKSVARIPMAVGWRADLLGDVLEVPPREAGG